jgi:hypothetical protein
MKNQPLLAAGLILGSAVGLSHAAQEPQNLPAGAEAMKIIVEDVSGKVQFIRDGQFQRMTKESVLTHGDKIVAGLDAISKLEFQHPTSGAVLSAVIIRGYTELTVAQAYLQGEQSTTQLDLKQGVIKAGVVRTAVPPSYRVRTPRTVLAVRGTEVAEIEASESGDRIRMGRVGIAMVHDSVPWFRSVRAGQGTEKPVAEDWRGGRLLRAIEQALIDSRADLRSPHFRGHEVHYDRDSFDFVEFPGDNMSGADPGWQRFINSSRPGRGICAQCRDEANGRGRGR